MNWTIKNVWDWRDSSEVQEFLLLLQRMGESPAPTWLFTSVLNSSSVGSDVLFWLLWASHTHTWYKGMYEGKYLSMLKNFL